MQNLTPSTCWLHSGSVHDHSYSTWGGRRDWVQEKVFFFLQMENYQLSVFTYTNLCFVKNIIQMLCMETYYMLYFSYKKVQRGGSCMILHSSCNSFWWNTMNLNCITQWSWFWEKTFSKNKYDCLRVCFDALWRSHFKLENLKSCPTFVDACFLWLVYLFCKALFFLVL